MLLPHLCSAVHSGAGFEQPYYLHTAPGKAYSTTGALLLDQMVRKMNRTIILEPKISSDETN